MARVCCFHVVVGDDGAVLGRVNLLSWPMAAPYWVARRGEGRGPGLATTAVHEVCDGRTGLRAAEPASIRRGGRRRSPDSARSRRVRPDWRGWSSYQANPGIVTWCRSPISQRPVDS